MLLVKPSDQIRPSTLPIFILQTKANLTTRAGTRARRSPRRDCVSLARGFLQLFRVHRIHTNAMSSSIVASSATFSAVSASTSRDPSSRCHRQLRFPTPPKGLNFTRRCSARLGCAKAMYSDEFWTPESSGRRGIWSIRDDLQVPSSPYFPAEAGEHGPPSTWHGRFPSVISELFEHRIIRFGGPVDDDMANIIVMQLLYLDAVDPDKDIVMYVNSPGGSVTAGMAIFDTMRHIRPRVSTVCVGLAASMAGFILSSGTKGMRYSLPNARIMIHQPMGEMQGSQAEAQIQFDEIEHHRACLGSYLAWNSGQSIQRVNQDTSTDFFMSAEEAKEYGLIDRVIINPLKGHQPLSATDGQGPIAVV